MPQRNKNTEMSTNTCMKKSINIRPELLFLLLFRDAAIQKKNYSAVYQINVNIIDYAQKFFQFELKIFLDKKHKKPLLLVLTESHIDYKSRILEEAVLSVIDKNRFQIFFEGSKNFLDTVEAPLNTYYIKKMAEKRGIPIHHLEEKEETIDEKREQNMLRTINLIEKDSIIIIGNKHLSLLLDNTRLLEKFQIQVINVASLGSNNARFFEYAFKTALPRHQRGMLQSINSEYTTQVDLGIPYYPLPTAIESLDLRRNIELSFFPTLNYEKNHSAIKSEDIEERDILSVD